MFVSSDRVAKFLIDVRWWLLAIAGLLALSSLALAPKVEFDRSVENLFSEDDPLLPPYRRLARTFGGNEVILAVYRDDNLLAKDGSGIRRLREISQELRDTPGVAEVMSLADLSDALSQMSAIPKFLRGKDAPPEAIADPKNAVAQRFRELFIGYTHGPDQKTAAIICMLTPSAAGAAKPNGKDLRRETVDILREKIKRLADGLIAGEPAMVVDGFRYLEVDGARLIWASSILLSITIAALFRSIRWILVPFAVVQFAILMTTTALSVLQFRLSMVSSMFSAIITVVGVATVVHIIIHYRDVRAEGKNPKDAFRETFRELWGPVLWSIVTDAIGFLSLIVAEVGPIQDFAIMASIGSCFVLVSVVLLIPGLTLLGQPENAKPPVTAHEGRLSNTLGKSIAFVRKYPYPLACFFGLLALFLTLGNYWLQVETDFTKNFRRGSPIVVAYNKIEEDLGGAGAWEVILPAPQRLDWEYLDRIDEFQHQIRRLQTPGGKPALTALSFVDAVKAATPQIADLPLPAMRNVAIDLAGGAMKAQLPKFTAALHAADPQDGKFYYRIMLRAPERQPAEQKKVLIEQVAAIAKREFPEAEATGFFVLLTYLIDSILKDQWLTFLVSTTGVGILITIVFRSPKMALIALVPNVLPITMVMGLMGWLGLRINLGAAMIAATSMGLSIDTSIHYLIAYQRARKRGLSVLEALNLVQKDVGRAVVFSTLALVIGFGALSVSQFIPTIYFGVLTGVTMLGGLIGNLLFLPLLLLLTERDAKKPV